MKTILTALAFVSTVMSSIAFADIHTFIHPAPGDIIYSTKDVEIQKATGVFRQARNYGVSLEKKLDYQINAIQQVPTEMYVLNWGRQTIVLNVVSKEVVGCGSTGLLLHGTDVNGLQVSVRLLDHTTRVCRDLQRYALIVEAEANQLPEDEMMSVLYPVGKLKFKANPQFIYYIQ